MKFTPTCLKGAFVIEPSVYVDKRGWFFDSYSKKEFEKHKINACFVQESQSLSKVLGTIRGLHFQKSPKAQAKLIRCTKGKVLDVIVDLRKKSPSYKKWISVELSDDNKKALFLPKGFAHGYSTLTKNVEMAYMLDEYYSPKHEARIRFDDPELSVDWQNNKPTLSQKDSAAPFLKDICL